MTDERDGSGPSSDDDGGAPVDFDRLEIVAERLSADDRFAHVEKRPSYAPERVVFVYDHGWYPNSVREARLEITWYENDDFSIHYHETHESGAFDHRWDRHPSGHNAREHVHPGPDAPTPGDDASHPNDWRDVVSSVLEEIERRQRAFWDESETT